MLIPPQSIGFLAGLFIAIFFVAIAKYPALTFLLALAPFPVLFTGLAWGTQASLLAFGTATLLIGLLANTSTMLFFVIVIGLPAFTLSYLSLLQRVVPATPEKASQVECYPLGHLIAWATIMVGSVVAIGFAIIGTDSYRQRIKEFIQRYSQPEVQSLFANEQFVELMSRFILPALATMLWLLVFLLNFWLAAKVAQIMQLLSRPWPSFTRIDYPLAFLVAFLVAVGVAMSSSHIGIMATAYVGAFSMAYMILGLTVVHVWIPDTPIKPIILASIYMGILVAGGVFVSLLVLLGLCEPTLELRRKALERSTPPDGA
jgi:hypothetical protein